MATWLKVFYDGMFTSQWKCSECNGIWEVRGLLTPIGMGYKVCPECNAEMAGIGREVDGEQQRMVFKNGSVIEFVPIVGETFRSKEHT